MNTYNLKISVFITLLFMLISGAFAQEADGPEFEFVESKHNFGDIRQDDKVEHIFKFRNSGTKPLIISNIITTCGCTAPSWTKEPILPKDQGEIKVVFDSTGKIGKQNKVITIFSNSVNQKERITITANVIPDL